MTTTDDATRTARYLAEGRVLEMAAAGGILDTSLDALAQEVGLSPDHLRACLRDMARAGWIAVQTQPVGRLTIRLELRIHAHRPVAVNRRSQEPNAWDL
jgi:DNA-binding transcriptional regulator PaaX